MYDDFVDDVLTGDEAKDGKLINPKGPAFVALEADLTAYASKYGDYEYVAAAYYMIAGGYLYLADLYYNLECPPQMDEESCDLFMEYIYETFYPKADNAQAKAITRLEKIQELGVEWGVYNDWIAQAANMLNEIDPTTYPSEKMLIRGKLDSVIYQPVEAMEFSEITEEPEPELGTGEQQQEVE